MTNSPLNTNNGSTNRPGASYQSIPTVVNNDGENTATSCGTGVLSPMAYLTRRDRMYRKLVGGLLIVILVALGTLMYFAVRPDPTSIATIDKDDDDDLVRQDQQHQAKVALRSMNRHSHRQHLAMPDGCETTLLIIRHCEKLGKDAIDEVGDEHCNYIGYQRAQYLATLFGTNSNNETRTRWPVPSYLYALTEIRGKNKNYREWETLQPLSVSIGTGIEMIPDDPLVFVQGTFLPLLRKGFLCGKVVVVAWKHSLFPEIANDVGCGPDQGCPTSHSEDDYDTVWQITLEFDPPTATSRKKTRNSRPKPQWYVYGTMVSQGFDPLAFSESSTNTYDGARTEPSRSDDEPPA